MSVRRRDYVGLVLADLLTDEEYIEALAEQAYIRERHEDAALAAEHAAVPDPEPMALAWESIPATSKRPYRTAAAVACSQIRSLCV